MRLAAPLSRWRNHARTSRHSSILPFRSRDPLLYSEDMKCSLQQIAEALDMRLISGSRLYLTGGASIGAGSADDLVFFEGGKHLARGPPNRGVAGLGRGVADANPS